jgi:hypothetical protein
MRMCLLSIFWITNVGSAIQLLVIASASWVIFSGTHSFAELNVDVFITQVVPWLLWLKTLIVALFGEIGRWVLMLPILIIAPLKLITGIAVGFWAYSTAKNMEVGPVHA